MGAAANTATHHAADGDGDGDADDDAHADADADTDGDAYAHAASRILYIERERSFIRKYLLPFEDWAQRISIVSVRSGYFGLASPVSLTVWRWPSAETNQHV